MMSLEPGRRLGPYEIVAPAGAGGMGEVYKAKDTRLERTVAIKILPAHLADDPDLKKRFEQEARIISNLNHPRICTLHDIGSEDGVDFLVMEFLEGETLAERLKRGPLPLDQALEYARQIADALDTAHRSGVVHRDLKPGNVMLTKDGVKLLDFGLAKHQAKTIDPALSALPTQDQPLTRAGSIVGTLHYMAPEQLEGKDVDTRADLFTLGAVLYEMVTGRKAFEGESPASIITAIMSATPPSMTELKPVTPPSLERVVSSCLAKDPDARWQSAGDLARELSWVDEEKKAETAKPSSRLAWSVAGLVSVVALGLLAVVLLRPRDTPELVRFTISPPEGTRMASLYREARAVVSPDGTRIAFLAEQEGSRWVVVRALEELEARKLTETAPPNFLDPVWSPDGGSILYRSAGKLMRIDVEGGGPRVVSDSDGFGIAWNAEGVLLASFFTGPIRRIEIEGGGGDAPVTTLEEGELRHTFPFFLPDGERFLYYVPGSRRIYMSALDSTERTLVRSADSAAIYVEPGYLLFVDGETLMAQRFAPSSGELEGQPVPLARGLYSSGFGFRAFSASRNVLAYREGTVEHRLEWFDRTGTSLGPVGEPGLYTNVVLSHDGRRAIVIVRGGSLWLLDLERGGIATRLTSDGVRVGDTAWSPDGKEIVMSVRRSGSVDLYRLSLVAGAEPELILSAEQDLWVDQWLAADNQVAFHNIYSISLLPMDGGEPRELVTQQDRLDEPYRSPDGHWLAFISDETGRFEVYLERLDTRERSRISTEGGGQPRWRADGKEVFYLGSDGTAMAVDVDPELGVRGVARALFETPIDALVPTSDQWDVHPDGDRFLFLVRTEAESPIHVILNWTTLLEEN